MINRTPFRPRSFKCLRKPDQQGLGMLHGKVRVC
jgi:hypothetical protein